MFCKEGIYLRTFIKKISKIVNIDKKEYLYNQLLCFFCLITYTASSIIFPSFLSKIVDIGIAKNDFHAILKYSLEMLLCGVIMVIFYYYQRVFFFRFGNKIVLDTRKKIYEKLCNVNIFFWNKHKVGDILTILDSDLDKLQELLTSNISELIVNLILAIGIASYIIILNIKIGVFVIALAVIFAIIQKLISNKSKEEMRIFREIIGDFNSYSTETINNMMSLQMTGKVSYIKKTYSNKCNILSLRGLRLTKILSMVSVTGTSFNILAIILVLFIGALDVSDGLLSVGLLFSMTIYVQRLYSPIVTLGNLFVKIRNFSPILENIYDLVSNENIIVQGSYKSQLPLTGKIEFKKVSFSYNGEDYVIKNFSEHLNPGDIVGIVGENGSGKTTICRLLTKLCDVTEGSIELDGINLNDIETDYLRTQIGVMTQDSFILTEEFNEFLNNKQNAILLQQYINSMNFSNSGINITESGFEIKENKLNISGGEAKKLALYKLYLENKPICILDEPTAFLDSVSEEIMVDFINNYFKGKTLIIITHKPEILRLCTKILKLTEKS